ncbi:MAG: tetratricopeptide repeat protein [Chloroflexota bacterium]
MASVIGRTFAVQLLAEVVGQASKRLEEPLAQLQRAEIAFPRRNPDLEYVFKHVSMRDAAYNTLVQKRRKELHLRTARGIAALYPSDEYAEMIAYHYAKTQAPEAAGWLEKAGDRAADIYACEQAFGHFQEAAKRYTLQGADAGVRARLEEKMGTVLYTAGRYDDALKHLETSAAIARTEGDLEGAGRVVARIGTTRRRCGNPEDGIALVAPTIELLAPCGPSQALAALHVALAGLFFVVGRYSDALSAAERGAQIARAIGSIRLLGEAEERRGTALSVLGQAEESVTILKEAIPLIEAGGDLMVLQRALNNVAVACWNLGRWDTATDYEERALEVAARIGNADLTAFNLTNLGESRATTGDWTGAREALERAATLLIGRAGGARSFTLAWLGRLALWEGDWEEARRLLAEALEPAGQDESAQVRETLQSFMAEFEVQTGGAEGAVRRLEPLLAAEAVHEFVPTALGWAVLGTGSVDRAAALATDTVRHLRQEARGELPEALRLLGVALRRQGWEQEGTAALEEALELAIALPFPYCEARVLEELGKTGEALAIFRRLGARKDVERIESGPAE